MLSPLQRKIAKLLVALDEAEGFALAGGAAMIVRGEIDRQTRDLDFFGLSAEGVDRFLPAAEEALRSVGFSIERVLVNSGFARLLIEGDGDRTEVDIGTDARLFPTESTPDGLRVLSREELAVDKILAIFGRAEARDFMDFAALARISDFDRHFDLASEKDRGFTPIVFAEMTKRFERLRREEFPVDDSGYNQLSRTVNIWRLRANEIARQRQAGLDRSSDTSLGFDHDF